MKRNAIAVFSLTLLSLLTGYFLSAISFAGRVGINLFYTEYKFLKTWWKGAFLVLAVWLILFIFQSWADKKYKKATSVLIQAVALLVAFIGLYFSYSDFRNTLSHRWLGERFHLGVYLFWIVWMMISVFLLVKKKPLPAALAESNVLAAK